MSETTFFFNSLTVKNTSESIRKIEYESIIGSIINVTHCTKLNIAYVVGRLYKFANGSSNEHCQASGKLLKYLKRTNNFGIRYQNCTFKF